MDKIDNDNTEVLAYEQKLCRLCSKNMTINAHGFCGTCRAKHPALSCELKPVDVMTSNASFLRRQNLANRKIRTKQGF